MQCINKLNAVHAVWYIKGYITHTCSV